MGKHRLIVHTNPKSPISEAYRTLRTNIQFSSLDKPVKTIVITSAGPGEGKTTSATNLAITMAYSGSKVLLVDADLRKPVLHRIFGISNQFGLTSVLVSELNYKERILPTYIEGLEILPVGVIPPNPSELLASNKMKQLLSEAREDYDFILIDTPPAAVVTDASILAAIADGTILVCSSGQVPIEGAIRAKELLENVNANIIGVILNKIPTDQKNYSHYYYYHYYYEGDEPSKNKMKNKKGLKVDG
ncbi:MAG TPA: CpsD/CapB family tyrosine-protein kinase [Oscillospiraceae bacterium]|nr:CpsD/CapB family tyrosine-protein kinase [Oscillospiraceae bacterium]